MLIDAGPRDQRPVQALPDYGLIYRGEAEGCVCISCNIVTPEAAALIQELPVTRACAVFVTAAVRGHPLLVTTMSAPL